MSEVVKSSYFYGFDTMTWPDPKALSDIAYRLRYGTPSKTDLLVAASTINAYQVLILDRSQKRRNDICKILKANPDRVACLSPDEQPPAQGEVNNA